MSKFQSPAKFFSLIPVCFIFVLGASSFCGGDYLFWGGPRGCELLLGCGGDCVDDRTRRGVIYPPKNWAGLDSNQRRLTPMGLQPIPFSRSGTDPF